MKKLSIYLMLAFAGLFMAACGPEDNEFAGLKVAEADGAVVVPGFSAGQTALIDLNAVEVSDALDVPAFTVPSTTLPEGVELVKGEVVFADGTILPATVDGKVSGQALSDYVASIYGLRPEARSVVGTVYLYAMQNGAAVKINAGEVTFQVVPKAPVIASAYYLTGTMNGWDNTNTDFLLSNGGDDPYANPTFTCTLNMDSMGNPSSLEFKATPDNGLGGDWSGCLAAGDEEGKFNYNNVGGNFKIEGINANTKYIRLTFNMLDQTWSYEEIAFNPFVYFIGATDGWSQADQKLALTNQNGIYTGYIYCADPNGWGNEFKFQRVAGSWDNEINYGTFTGGVNGDLELGGGSNIKATAGEGIYFFTLDLANGTLNAVRINNMNLVGSFNGWNPGDDAQQMTWDAENYCYVINNAGVDGNGWKFTANNGWGINLGGNDSVEPSMMINDLAADGKNLGAVGKTIKLYPTRKTSDKIFCTVE